MSSSSPPPFDDEEECRVCRGPAEEGYPLFSPCKCSGSIGLTHQDCLASWLEVQRLDGRCELCGTKFRFAPCYAENAPTKLPAFEVILGLSRAAMVRWFPWIIRMITALGLWFLIVPLSASYAYIGWLYSPSAIVQRLRWNFLLSDAISGAVIAAMVLVTFLSLMSFADFLRFNVQQGVRNRENNEEPAEIPIQDRDIDDVVLDHHHIARRQRNVNAVGVMDQRQPVIAQNGRVHQNGQNEDNLIMDRFMGGIPADPNAQRLVLQRRIRAAAALQRHLEAIEDDEVVEEDGDLAQAGARPLDDEEHIADFFQAMEDLADHQQDVRFPQRQNEFEPQFEPMNEAMEQEQFQDDVEMNVALDELLGLRGPYNTLIRNILLFVVFVIVYLGLFAFVPRFVGLSIFKRLGNLSNYPSASMDQSGLSVLGNNYTIYIVDLIGELNAESHRLGRVLKLSDVSFILLGYTALALFIVLIKCCVSLRQGVVAQGNLAVETNENEEREQPMDNNFLHQNGWDNPNNFDGRAMNDDAIEIRITIGQFLSLALDCVSALVKVGSLLFLKMLLLPLILGVWLDVVTLRAFDQSPSARALHAGSDLFSAILVHWVIGITFMLLVTVSVLQLREVLHPGLLANAIRPQEPQPDLLGNLLNESVSTHAKRMALSFGVYAGLLMVYIWFPTQILALLGVESYIPFFRPKFWYFLSPQFQAPLELLIFHITMLGYLEKYKNSIGGLQHAWLARMCESMGLTDYVLPRNVENFVFLGSKAIFIDGDDPEPEILDDTTESTPCLTKVTSCPSEALSREEAKQNGGIERAAHNFRDMHVDPFWYELARTQTGVERFVEAHIDSHNMVPRYEPVVHNRNRKVSLDGCRDFIRVPLPLSEQDLVDRRRRRGRGHATSETEYKNLIPSHLGKFRLRRNVSADGTLVIEFWKECRGDLVQRPPEGWDDLGVGGAEVQGRWAWGSEKKSAIENNVAMRDVFFGNGTPSSTSLHLIVKLLMLIILSWGAIVVSAVTAVNVPLLAGRTAFHCLRVPDAYLHDPLAFGVGLMILSTIITMKWQHGGINLVSFLWTRRIRSVPKKKVIVVALAIFVWTVVFPSCIGVLYDIVLIRTFDSMISFPAPATVVLRIWESGSFLLNLWAFSCVNSVFTSNFWVSIRNRVFEAEGNAVDADNLDIHANTDRPDFLSWQGSRNGRIACFFEVLVGAIFRDEWDLVDPKTLFEDCIYPIARMLTWTLGFPIICTGAISALLHFTGNQVVASQVLPSLRQCFCVLALTVQAFTSFSDELSKCFQAAHKVARDNRYLIGEVLLNYSPTNEQ